MYFMKESQKKNTNKYYKPYTLQLLIKFFIINLKKTKKQKITLISELPKREKKDALLVKMHR